MDACAPPPPRAAGKAEFVAVVGVVGVVLWASRWYHPSMRSDLEMVQVLPGLGLWCGALAVACIVLRLPLVTTHAGAPGVAVRMACLAACLALTGIALALPLRPGLAWILEVLTAGAVFHAIGGRAWLRVVLPALLLGAAPVAFGEVEAVVSKSLQGLAANFSHRFCHVALAAPCEREGYELRLFPGGSESSAPPTVLTVAPECGGYRSLCGMSLAAVVFAAHPAVAMSGKLLIGAAAGVLAVALNLLRLGVTLSLYESGNAQLARGTAHALLSQLVLAAGVGVLYLMFRSLLRRSTARDQYEAIACT